MEELQIRENEKNVNQNQIDKKKWSITAVIAIVVLSIIIIAAFVLNDTSNTLNGISTATKKIEVSGTTMTYEYNSLLDDYDVTIRGTAKNVSGKNLSYVQIEFSVYGINGSNLGTAWANINNLASGDIWNFEATLFSTSSSSQPDIFKLVNITAW